MPRARWPSMKVSAFSAISFSIILSVASSAPSVLLSSLLSLSPLRYLYFALFLGFLLSHFSSGNAFLNRLFVGCRTTIYGVYLFISPPVCSLPRLFSPNPFYIHIRHGLQILQILPRRTYSILITSDRFFMTLPVISHSYCIFSLLN